VRVPTELRALTGDAVVPAADATDAGVWGLLVGVGAAMAGPTVVISTAGMVGGRRGRGGGGGSGRGRKLFFARAGGGGRTPGWEGWCDAGSRSACERKRTMKGVSEIACRVGLVSAAVRALSSSLEVEASDGPRASASNGRSPPLGRLQGPARAPNHKEGSGVERPVLRTAYHMVRVRLSNQTILGPRQLPWPEATFNAFCERGWPLSFLARLTSHSPHTAKQHSHHIHFLADPHATLPTLTGPSSRVPAIDPVTQH